MCRATWPIDGAGGEAHDELVLGEPRISVGSFLVMRAICVFDAMLLVGVAIILSRFMQHPAGLIGAAICCLGAGISIGAARWLDRLYGRSS
jgi:hypothetical protein